MDQSSPFDYDEYEEAELAKLRLTEQQTRDLNRVLQALARVPVVRLSGADDRKELLFTERLIIARTLVPVMEQVREDERGRQSTDDRGVELQVQQEGCEGEGVGGTSKGSDTPT